MITKNEFYGAYLIDVINTEDKADYVISVLIDDVEKAWATVERLQKEPEVRLNFITDEEVSKAINSLVDDNAEVDLFASRERDLVKEFKGERILSNDGSLVGSPETIKEYNKDPSRWNELEGNFNKKKEPFFTDEQKAEIKAIVNS